MNIFIYSIFELCDVMRKGRIDDSTAIISFGDNSDDHIDFSSYKAPLDFFLVNFKDLDYCDEDEDNLSKLFYQKEELAQYIKEKIAEGKDIICQCYEGVSRSSATAWAISEYIDIPCNYENNPRYQPNKFIYKTLSKLLKKQYLKPLVTK